MTDVQVGDLLLSAGEVREPALLSVASCRSRVNFILLYSFINGAESEVIGHNMRLLVASKSGAGKIVSVPLVGQLIEKVAGE